MVRKKVQMGGLLNVGQFHFRPPPAIRGDVQRIVRCFRSCFLMFSLLLSSLSCLTSLEGHENAHAVPGTRESRVLFFSWKGSALGGRMPTDALVHWHRVIQRGCQTTP